jgi:hypothetical protein
VSLAAFHAIRDCRSKRWLAAHLDYPHDDRCLIWPFARKGGGYVTMGKKGVLVHRVACEHRNGPPPSPEHHAAHSCGRGHDGCINPWHLNWRTPTENQLERYEQHGLLPRYKLTLERAQQIRGMQGFASADIVAAQFGVSESNVRLVWTGKTWNSECPRVFTEQEVGYIRSTPWQVKSAKVIAKEFGVLRSVIERIRAGKTYRYFSDTPQVPPAHQPSAEAIENKGPRQS